MLEFDDERIARARRCRETVAARLISAFFDIRAEQAVEYDEYAAIVRIEIIDVRCVVHAMRGRRIEHVFEPAEFRRPRVMQPELIKQVETQRRQHDFRPHAEPHERREKHRRAGYLAGQAEPVSRRERQLVRRVVNRMRRPEKTDAVRRAVVPVVAELLADKEQEHHQRAVERDGEDPVIPGKREDRRC